MRRTLFLSLSSLLLLVSCGNTNGPVKVSNSIAGFETGIPSVELTRIYGSEEKAAIQRALLDSLNRVTAASVTNYRYQISNDMTVESSATSTTSYSFFGTDKQYSVTETNNESVQRIGNAVTATVQTKMKSEYAVGDKKRITYIKNTYTSASGSETTSYRYGYNEAGSANIRRSHLSDYVSGFALGGILGSTKDGKLYYVCYSETSSRPSAYNSDGEQVSGLARAYNHILFDLNTIAEPRYNAVRSVIISETNVGKNGIKTDAFHINGKTSSDATFEYGTITENAQQRSNLIESYPEETLKNIQVFLYRNGSPYNQIYLSESPDDDMAYTGAFNTNSSSDSWSFRYSAAKYQIDKRSELVSSDAINDQILPIDDRVIYYGDYPQDIVTVENNAITSKQSISMKLFFRSLHQNPYFLIQSIELQ